MILDMLPKEYSDNYLKWLTVTNVLKGLNKLDIWDSFSRKSKKYNKHNNITIWNNINSFLDVNYLISIINSFSSQTKKLELIESYKPYEPFTTPMTEFNVKEFDTQYVSDGFLFKEFQENSTIIMESCTGTGKTTSTAKHFKELHDKNPHLRILSLVNKISLADQHVKSFKEQGVKMVSYEDKNKNIYTDHLVVCINSIRILNDLPLKVLKNKVVYIVISIL
jgi:superfamily II DNA or RNA helicase